jgi:hypothetical protein
MKSIKKIRLNKNNQWYFSEFITIINSNIFITSNKLRSTLLNIVINNKDYAKDTDKENDKFNDTLFTYSMQFAIMFNFINRDDEYLYPSCFSKILEENFNCDIFSTKIDTFFSMLLFFSDLTNDWRIIEFVNNKKYKTINIVKYLSQKAAVEPDEAFIENITSVIDLYIKYDLITKKDRFLTFNSKDLNKFKSEIYWKKYSTLKKKYINNKICEAFIEKYYEIEKTTNKGSIRIMHLLSFMSLKMNSPYINFEKFIKQIPIKYKNYNIYLQQGRAVSNGDIIKNGKHFKYIEIVKLN